MARGGVEPPTPLFRESRFRRSAAISAARVHPACLIVDFDGPICNLFAGYPALDAAADLRRAVAAQGYEIATADVTGPHQLLSAVAESCPPAIVRVTADALRDIELMAAASAALTLGADELLQVVHDTGRRTAVVSNNSAAAVRTCLERYDLRRLVDHISARDDDTDPRRLKPSPHLVSEALTALDTQSFHAVLVGDSTTDVAAGLTAGVSVIGYANKPGKRATLGNAGAAAMVDTLAELSDALRGT